LGGKTVGTPSVIVDCNWLTSIENSLEPQS
jgi:hypothetical protein